MNDPLSPITLSYIKKALQQLPEEDQVILFYLISFIHVFLMSNREGCGVFEEDCSPDNSSLEGEYSCSHPSPFHCLFELTSNLVSFGLEEVASFFFRLIWQVKEGTQSDQLYSVFLV